MHPSERHRHLQTSSASGKICARHSCHDKPFCGTFNVRCMLLNHSQSASPSTQQLLPAAATAFAATRAAASMSRALTAPHIEVLQDASLRFEAVNQVHATL